MNQVILIGRLTRDPELVYTPGNQTAVTHFSIVVSKELQDSQTKHIAIVHLTIKKSCQMALRQLKRIYHSR